MAKLPPTTELLHAMEVAKSSPEAAGYLAARFEAKLIAEKVLEQSRDMLRIIQEFAERTISSLTPSTDAWAGQPEASKFKNLQANRAAEAIGQLEHLGSESKNVRMDVAINNEAEFVRGYAVDGQAVDADAMKAFDSSFNAWLAENNMISKGSTFYEVNQDGQIKRDAQGNEVKADAAKVKELMNDSQKGFAAYLNRKGIEINIQQQEYPGATASMNVSNRG